MIPEKKSRKILLFGNLKFAEFAWYALTHDSPYEVAAFVVDRAYLTDTEIFGVPVVSFEDVEQLYTPADYDMIIPLGYQGLNALRKQKYLAAKAMGYNFVSYISPRASVWANVEIGENCWIDEFTSLQPFSSVGNNSILLGGIQVSHHVSIREHCFVAAGTSIGGGAVISDRCFLGLSSTVRNNLDIAERTFIAAGSVVVADTQPNGLYLGVPAKRTDKPADEAD